MSDKEQDRLNLGKFFTIVLMVAILFLALGYIIMSRNEISISAVLLLVAYTILIPLALLWRPRKKDQ